MLQMFVTILTAGDTGLLARCNCNNHFYFSGLLHVQQTAQMVGYCYNKHVCWSGASVSDMQACRHMFTERYDCWLDATVNYMEMAGCNCYRHG